MFSRGQPFLDRNYNKENSKSSNLNITKQVPSRSLKLYSQVPIVKMQPIVHRHNVQFTKIEPKNDISEIVDDDLKSENS